MRRRGDLIVSLYASLGSLWSSAKLTVWMVLGVFSAGRCSDVV